MVCTYDGKLFSQEKKEKTLTFATIEMDLEDTVLSEISQTQEGKYCTISFIQRNLKYSKSWDWRAEWWSPGLRVREDGEVSLKGTKFQSCRMNRSTDVSISWGI